MQASKKRSDRQDQVSLHFAFTKSNTRKKKMKKLGRKKEARDAVRQVHRCLKTPAKVSKAMSISSK